MNQETHYEVLGVPKEANIAQIRHAYRRLIFQYHPDRNQAKDAKEIFVRVTEAFEVLGDPSSRKRYDALLGSVPATEKEPKPQQRRAESRPKPKAEPEPEPVPDAPQPTIRNARVEITRLRTLLGRGKVGEAEQLARILTREVPDEALPYAVLGDMARNRGHMQRAAEFYALAIQKEPRNLHFQNQYEAAVKSTRLGPFTAGFVRQREPSVSSVIFAFALTSCCGFYIALDKELPLIREPKVLSTWTLGVIIMLFLSGLAMGAGLSVGGHLEPIYGATKNARFRTPVPIILGLVSLLNFWLATLGYALISGLRGSLNNSVAKMVAGVAAATLAVGCGASLNERLDALQVLLWGGNVAYFGGLLGWISAERLA